VEVSFPVTSNSKTIIYGAKKSTLELLVHIVKHRIMNLVVNKNGKINRSGGITMCQSYRSRKNEQ